MAAPLGKWLLAAMILAGPAAAQGQSAEPSYASQLGAPEKESWLRREFRKFRIYPLRDRYYRLMARGERGAAADVLSEILSISPEDDAVRFELMTLFYEDGAYPDAAREADALISRRPYFGPARFYRGLIRYEAGAREKASDDLARALELGGLKAGDSDRALSLLGRIALEGTYIVVTRNRRSLAPVPAAAPKPEAALVAQAVPPPPVTREPALDPAAALLDQGFAALRTDRPDEALAKFDAAAAMGAGPVADLYRGYALMRLERRGAAKSAFEMSLEGEPPLTAQQQAAAWREIGTLAAAENATEEATAALEAALALHYDTATAVRLARLYRQQGRDGQAVALLESVDVAGLPASLRALYFEDRAYFAERAGQPEDAAKWQQQAVQAEPTADRWATLGRMRLKAEQTAAAVYAYENALALRPESPELEAQLGYAFLAAKDQLAARRHLAAAAPGLDRPARVYEDIGYIAKTAGDRDAAARAFRAAIDYMTEEEAADDRHLLRLGQEIQWIEDSFDLDAYWVYRSAALPGRALSPLERSVQLSQGGLSLDVLPPGLGHETGRYLSFSGRLLWSHDGDSLDIVEDSLQAGLGLKAKPFADHNLILGAERLLAVGEDARNDWMLRASYSASMGLDAWFSAERLSDWAGRIYLDAAMIDPEDPDFYFAGEGLFGWAARRRGPVLWWPHIVAAANLQDDRFGSVSLIEAGPGLGLRLLFDRGHYRAYAGNAEIFLQYRVKLAGDTAGGSGLVLLTSIQY